MRVCQTLRSAVKNQVFLQKWAFLFVKLDEFLYLTTFPAVSLDQ